ncbi:MULTISPECIES: hypothetical protein [unclassified Sphingomonas]|uniref:hypothetical protein n=1 Tax=unclassified Sphingomonas TaxID=196159 RepID=UPI00104A0A78|nr:MULTISPECIES: hypothetical protein [unclassified Sphingomonas]
MEDSLKPWSVAIGTSRPARLVMGSVMVVAMLAGISQVAIGSPGAADAKRVAGALPLPSA